jgi:hypothetical protein
LFLENKSLIYTDFGYNFSMRAILKLLAILLFYVFDIIFLLIKFIIRSHQHRFFLKKNELNSCLNRPPLLCSTHEIIHSFENKCLKDCFKEVAQSVKITLNKIKVINLNFSPTLCGHVKKKMLDGLEI